MDQVEGVIDVARRAAGRPLVVGISGFGGSGKSTAARSLARRAGTVRMRGDDFLDPVRSHLRSSDWSGVDRVRLVEEVLLPFREGRASTFRRFDWSRRALAEPEPVPSGDVMIVDLIGLFHPDAWDALDLTLWCDVDLEIATRRGMARDRSLGRDHDRLWTEVWVPNEIDFADRFRPRERASILLEIEIEPEPEPEPERELEPDGAR